MDQLNNILIATDFSPCANSALKQAIRMAKLNDAQLHILHAIDSGITFELAETLETSLTEIRDQLIHSARHEIEALLKPHDLEAKVEIQIGTQIEQVVTHARRVNADLLVVGEHSEQSDNAPAGVLATRCLRKGGNKVLLVDKNTEGPFSKLLTCVDFSESSKTVVQQAQRIASQNGSKIRLLHVYDFPWNRIRSAKNLPKPTHEQQEQYVQKLKTRLENLAKDHLEASAECQVVTHQKAGQGISNVAKEWQADLIVVGKRGHSSWTQMMLGSTAESLVREPNCSVLAVSPN